MKTNTFVTLIIFLLLAGCASILSDYERPGASITPSNESVVQRDAVITINFSEAMDSQITESYFGISTGSQGNVAGRIHWENGYKRMIFTPLNLLEANGQYIVRLGKSAEDKKGNDLEKDYTIYFSVVGNQQDRPRFLASTPSHMQMGIAEDTTIILNFDKSIDRASIETGISLSPGTDYTTSWQNNDTTIIITPKTPLSHGVTYKVSLNEGLKDVDGNKLYENREFLFTVGNDFAKPVVEEVLLVRSYVPSAPLSQQVNITNNETNAFYFNDENEEDLKPAIQITFSKEIAQQKFLNAFTFSVPIDITWLANNQVLITLLKPLTHSENYKVELTTNIEDTMGNDLYRNYAFQFRMGQDLTPLEINNIIVDGASYALSDQEITMDNSNPIISISFNSPVDMSSFSSNFSLSPSVSNKNYSWNAASTQVQITFTDELKWHTRYELSFSKEITALNRNKMNEDGKFFINMGSDYIKPDITTITTMGGGVNGGTALVNNTVVNNIEKNEYIEITFSENMDIKSIKDNLKIVNYNTRENYSFLVDGASNPTFKVIPQKYFDSSETYEISINKEITDIQGNSVNASQQGRYYFVIDHINSSAVKLTNISMNGSTNAKVWKAENGGGVWIPLGDYDPLLFEGAGICDDWVLFHFNKQLNPFTVKQNISISGKGGGSQSVTIDWDDISIEPAADGGTNVIIKKMEASGGEASVYGISLLGGSSGIKDIYGNEMKENFNYHFTR